MKGKVDSVIKIPTTLDNFFRYWFEFLKPIHQLSRREIDVASSLVKHRYLLSKAISDEALLDKMSLSTDVRKQIMQEHDLPPRYFNVVISNLKKNKVIVDGRINPKFIPRIKEDKGNFQLLLLYDFNDSFE